MQYAKPGDVLDVEMPVLFKIESKARLDVDTALFPNAYDVSRLSWRKDSSAVTFEYNQRGHQVFRVIEIDRESGKARAVISEEPKTFFCYSGKRFRQDLEETKEITLDVGARWLESSLPLRQRHRRGEEPDHKGSLAGPERRQRRREGTADLFHGERHVSGQGSVLRLLLPDQLRRHRPRDAHAGRRQSHRHVLAGPIVADRYLLARRRGAGHRAAVGEGRVAASRRSRRPTSRRSRRPAGSRRKCSSPRVATARPTSGASSTVRPTSIRRRSIPSSRTSTPVRRARSCRRRSARTTRCRPRPRSASSSSRSTAWERTTGRRRSTTSPGRTWTTPASPTASSGIRRWRRNIRTTTSRASGLYGTSAGGQNSLGGAALLPGLLQGGGVVRRLSRQPDGQDLVERAVDGMADRSRVRGRHPTSTTRYRLQGKVLLVVGEMDNNVDPASTYQVVNQLIKTQQGFRAARHPRRRPHQRRRLRRAQAVRLLRAAPARRQATGVESDRGSDQEAGDDGFDPVEAGFSRPCRPLNSTQGSIAARKACPLLRSTWIDGRWCSGIRCSSTNPS